MALYNKYRPSTFMDMKGDFININNMLYSPTPPHAFLFTGPSGVGKTTAARILATSVGATDIDITEINVADKNGVEDIRIIIEELSQAKFGKASVYILDECHKLSEAAANALLKPLEDCPKDTYFVLCTTNPDKVLNAIKTRCVHYKFPPLSVDDIFDILKDIAAKEKLSINRETLITIAEKSNGSARLAIMRLQQAADLDKTQRELYIEGLDGEGETPAEVIELCRAVYSAAAWPTVAELLRKLKGKYEAETIRHSLLGYGAAILLKNPSKNIIQTSHFFLDNLYDSGYNGLVVQCAKDKGV
jgi:DNA polymerase III gamma/tau subunit